MAVLSPVAKQQFFTNAGAPAAGYLLYTYAANTTTPQATYTNKAGTVEQTNPIVLDSAGRAAFYLDPTLTYDYVLKTAAGVTVWTQPGVEADNGLRDLGDATDPDLGAALVAYTPPETGGVARTLYDLAMESVSDGEFGCAADGETDDKAALDNAMAAAVARGRTLSLDGSAVYAVSGFLSFPSNLRLQTNGAIFRDLTGTTSNTPFITVGNSNVIDELNVEIPAGIRRDRAVLVTSTSPQITRIAVTSIDQQANTGDNDDAAVRVSVSTGARIRHIAVANYDRAAIFRTATDLRVSSLKITNYVRGLQVEDCLRCVVDQGAITGASANTSYAAGNVGVLLSSSTTDAQRNITLQDFVVEDSGEHGIRIAGPAQQSNIHIVRPRIKNVGGSGIKILGTNSGTPSDTNKRIYITDPVIEDCGSGTVTSNMCGVLVMFADGVYITNPTIRSDSKTVSASSAIRVAASSNVHIIEPDVSDAQDDGLYLDGSLGDLSHILVRGGVSQGNGRDGFRFSIFSSAIDDVVVDGLSAWDNTGLGFTWASTGGAGITGRPRLRVWTRGNTAGAGACDSAEVNLQVVGAVGSTPLSGISARPGSTWDDETSLNVMKATTWTAL